MTKKVIWISLVEIVLRTTIVLYAINAQKYVDFRLESWVAGK